jgi:hypothetical protein
LNWPPIRSILRSAHAGKSHDLPEHPSLFIKIYMEGIPIGRKLNLFAEDGYEGLIRTIGHMFPTTFISKYIYQKRIIILHKLLKSIALNVLKVGFFLVLFFSKKNILPHFI